MHSWQTPDRLLTDSWHTPDVLLTYSWRIPDGLLMDSRLTPDLLLTTSQWTSDGPQHPLHGPLTVPNRSLTDPEGLQLLWIVSSNSISKWALQCLFTFCNITILGCNSNYSTLYSMLLLDTNVYNDSYLTSYYQWLVLAIGRRMVVVTATIGCTQPSAVQNTRKLRW